MFYVTVKQSPRYHQMSFEEFLFGGDAEVDALINQNLTNTRTYEVQYVSDRFSELVDAEELIQKLRNFNAQTEELRAKPRHELYREFYIPKKSGGLRRIDAPDDELMDALRRLKSILENDFAPGLLKQYHTSAFAYIKNRSTIDCLKRHQENESKWFGKYDLHDFFGSTTLEFVMQQLSMVFPFCKVMKWTVGDEELRKALELAFLDGGLPQGTPISPLLTNIMMIPVDFILAKELRDHEGQRYVYTRYADDIQVSSRYTFSFKEIEKLIVDTLAQFNAPFRINEKKTRYGSSSGSNWNLGLMLNKDNQITVGYKNKRKLKAMLSSYIQDKLNGKSWDKNDVQVMEGHRNYCHQVEGETIDAMVEHINQKFHVNVQEMIKQDIAGDIAGC